MLLRSVGGRNRRCLPDFLARFGVHADELWTSCWARFGVGKTDARSNAEKKGEDAAFTVSLPPPPFKGDTSFSSGRMAQ
ncbi:MAG TPA: hypothetical protein QF564_06920 [Pirellulaceae bacterium]|nr:hypothetical protein [Pirellulaceae bacterium]